MKTTLIGVVLENSSGSIALQLRDEKVNIINPGMWSIFGGHLEPGEDIHEGACREILEELSIAIDPVKLQLLGRFERDNYEFYVFRYPIKHELESAKLKEGQAWRWCTPNEIRQGTIGQAQVVDYHVAFLEAFWSGQLPSK